MAARRDDVSTHHLHLQSLALGVSAGVCSLAIIQCGLRVYRRGRQGYRAADVPPHGGITHVNDKPTTDNSSANGTSDEECNGEVGRGADVDTGEGDNRLLRRAEAVLSRRTDRVLVVLENCRSHSQQQAALRTCDCLGIQHVWLVGGAAAAAAMEPATAGGSIASAADDAARWLSVRRLDSTAECIAALREQPSQTEIWATDLSQSAEGLDALLRRCAAGRRGGLPAGKGTEGGLVGPEEAAQGMPERVALVFGGSEAEGVSREMLLAADRRIYMPLHGMAESLDVSAALCTVAHAVRGAWSVAEHRLPAPLLQELRGQFYGELMGGDEGAQALLGLKPDGGPLNPDGGTLLPPFSDLRLPDSAREPLMSSARKVRQRREILGKQIDGARQPEGFGSSAAAPASPQLSEGARGQSPGPSPTASVRRTLFDGGGAAAAQQAPAGGSGAEQAEVELKTVAQRDAAQSTAEGRPMLVDGRLAGVVPVSALSLALANETTAPRDTALPAPAAVNPRQRPWLSQSQDVTGSVQTSM